MRDVAVVAYQLTVPVLSLPLFHQLKGYVFQLYIQQSKSTLLFCFVHPPSESLRRHVRLSHERKSPDHPQTALKRTHLLTNGSYESHRPYHYIKQEWRGSAVEPTFTSIPLSKSFPSSPFRHNATRRTALLLRCIFSLCTCAWQSDQ